MKIAVISDIHDNWANLDQFCLKLRENNDINHLIVCGDIASPATLKKLSENLPQKKIYAVPGNVDGDIQGHQKVAEESNNITFFNHIGEIELSNKKIAFTHKPQDAQKLANSGKYDVVFYGHTHKAWEERLGKTLLINPGELTYFFYTPTYCLFDLNKMKAKLVLLYQ